MKYESVFGLFLGKRRTYAQKIRFIKKIAEIFKQQGFESTVSQVKTVLSKTINVYFGDINKADIIICAYYDTPLKSYMPMHAYYPMNGKKTNTNRLVDRITVLAVYYMMMLPVLYFILSDIWTFPAYQTLCKVSAVLIILFVTNRLNNGTANTWNFNQNTSSILAMIDFMEERNHGSEIAFAFIDNGTSNNLGARLLYQDLNANDVPVIFLDCIGDGDVFCIGHTAEAIDYVAKRAEQKIVLNEERTTRSYSVFFKKAVIIASGQLLDDELVVKNAGTKKDTSIIKENIVKTKELLAHFTDSRNHGKTGL